MTAKFDKNAPVDPRMVWLGQHAPPHKDYHTVIIPLEPSEDPDPKGVAKMMLGMFGHFPFAETRLPLAKSEILEDKKTGARGLVMRFLRWKGDPDPDYRDFREARYAGV